MRIGVPREIKVHEYRVGLTPASVQELVSHGHEVLVQTDADAGIGQSDAAYRQAGASIAPDASAVYGEAELIVKVKEPQPSELPLLRPGQMLYAYLHLAADEALAKVLVRSGAVGMGARVTALNRGIDRLRELDTRYGNRIVTRAATRQEVEAAVLDADLVVGAVLVPGAAAPRLVSRELVSRMKTDAVVVDVAIDQGGCFETSRPTTHAEPTYRVDGVTHYCVTNMPGNVPRTSTFGLNNATLPHALTLADKGWQQAMQDDEHLRAGLNVAQGQVTVEAVARRHGLAYVPAEQLL